MNHHICSKKTDRFQADPLVFSYHAKVLVLLSKVCQVVEMGRENLIRHNAILSVSYSTGIFKGQVTDKPGLAYAFTSSGIM
ncbi:hypothetical protein [Gynuella sp.]|uniref:hypothetical protein n=1 Tax=Gynuella sp. TaxID=2969146 RepID=UPI003D12B185